MLKDTERQKDYCFVIQKNLLIFLALIDGDKYAIMKASSSLENLSTKMKNMSDENEIKWPLYERHLRTGGILYDALKEIGFSSYRIREFVDGLKTTTEGAIDKREMEEYLEYLGEQEGDYFTRSKCREIAKRLGVRFV